MSQNDRPRGKRRVWPIVLAILAMPFVFVIGCTAFVGAGIEAASQPVAVTYQVEGSAGDATLTYSTESGMSQESGADLPWSKTVEWADGFVAMPSVTGTAGMSGGDVTCRILGADGAVLAENTASGLGASASCHSVGQK